MISNFFSTILVVILKNSDILVGSEYKRETSISKAADNNSFSRAMGQAIGHYAFVRRIH